MKKSFLVIGLSRFGLSVVQSLTDLGAEVIAVDINEEAVKKVAEYTEHCFICDGVVIEDLKAIGANNVDHAIVTIGGKLDSTILTYMNLRDLGVKRITVRIDDERYIEILKRLGATEFISPENTAGNTLANQIIGNSVLEYYYIDKKYGISKIQVSSKFKAIQLLDLDSRNKFDVNIVGIIRNNNFFIPKETDSIEPNDIILVIGRNSKMVKFEQKINKEGK